jgi:hypothetical protein
MIWLTWRQFRVQALSVLVLLAGLAVALAVTGPRLYDLYRDGGLAACTADCGELADAFLLQAIGGSNRPLYGAPASWSRALTVWCGRRRSAGPAG